jgi:hypothetical protein
MRSRSRTAESRSIKEIFRYPETAVTQRNHPQGDGGNSLFLLVVVGLSLLLLLHRWPFRLYWLKPSAVRALIRKSLPDLRHL